MTSTEACSDFITEDCSRNHIWPNFKVCTTLPDFDIWFISVILGLFPGNHLVDNHCLSLVYSYCLFIDRLWKLQLSTNNVDVVDRSNSALDPGSSKHIEFSFEWNKIDVLLFILWWTDAIDMSKLQHHCTDSSIPLTPPFFHSFNLLHSAHTTALADSSSTWCRISPGATS